MTLVMSIFDLNQGYVAQLSDRRLCADGSVVDDEANKAISVTTDDAQLVCGFTGLARAGAFDTHDWLLDTLLECAEPDFSAEGIIQRVASRASTVFASHPDLVKLRVDQKRLAILLSGFLSRPDRTDGVFATITNFDAYTGPAPVIAGRANFDCRLGFANRDTPLAWVGSLSCVKDEDTRPIAELVARGQPPKVVIDTTVAAFRRIADRAGATGPIGKQLSSILINLGQHGSVATAYHAHNPSYIEYMPSVAVLKRSGTFLAKGGMFHVGSTPIDPADAAAGRFTDEMKRAGPIAKPRPHKNAPCPCGSGKKYRDCHWLKGRTTSTV